MKRERDVRRLVVDRGGDPVRRALLERNQELRKHRQPFALPDHSGHVAFEMPSLDYWYWTWKYPELAASDPIVARKAWNRFLNTPEGEKYKINPTEGRRAPVDRIIVR